MSSAPDRAQVRARIISATDDDPELDAARVVARREAVEIDGRKAFFSLRTLWSVMIIIWISVFIIFHAALAFAIGFGWLDFTSHQWLIPLIVVENFLQIVGMGYIVVRFFHAGSAGPAA